MAQGKLGRVKKTNAKKAYRVLRRVLPKAVAKAGANRVGQVTRLSNKRRSRTQKRSRNRYNRRRRRY
jgi:hypothetical protein